MATMCIYVQIFFGSQCPLVLSDYDAGNMVIYMIFRDQNSFIAI